MNDVYQTSLAAMNDVTRRLIEFLPNLLSAVLMLLLGWIVAKIVEKASARLLRALHTDQGALRIGVTPMLHNLGMESPPTVLISRSLFWLLFGLFVVSALEAMRLLFISQLISQLLAYLPNLIGAVLIFFVGLAGARLLGSSVTAGAKNANLEYAQAIGACVRYFLALLVVMVALAQLGVRTDILASIVTVLMVSLGLALALSLGLGSRAVVANILAGAFARDHFPKGREVEVEGIKGKILVVGSVGTDIECPGRQITIPNSLLIDRIVE